MTPELQAALVGAGLLLLGVLVGFYMGRMGLR